MLALTLIIFACIVSAGILFKTFTPAIMNWNMSPLPDWLANTIKITLTIIVSACIFVGVACMFIVMLACSMGGANTK